MFKHNKGYTLLFAIIVSSIVLSVAVFIISSSRRQSILSSTVRDSTLAMYAADGAMQCAVMAYYKIGSEFSTTSGLENKKLPCYVTTSITDPSSVFNYTIKNSPTDTSTNIKNGFVYEATVIRLMPNNTCAKINITWGVDKTTDNEKAVIDAYGYNFDTKNYAPCKVNGSANPRAVERGIRTQFNM